MRSVSTIESKTGRGEAERLVSQAAGRGRADAWARARELSRSSSPWELEFFKATLGEPEVLIGMSHLLADSEQAGEPVPLGQARRTGYFDKRTQDFLLVRRGLRSGRRTVFCLRDRVSYLAGSIIAFLTLFIYLVRARGGGGMARVPKEGSQLLAVHAEWTNRTRHVLEAVGQALTPRAIIILGRPRKDIDRAVSDWTQRLGHPLPQVIVPASIGAALSAFPEMLRLFTRGFSLVGQQPFLPGFREMSAIVFRVMLGAVMRRWWLDCGFRGGEVIYGHTGTADTTMLESAQQEYGTRTVHIVHGLSTGPNFIGFSDSAWFRCGYDADLYASLRHYGRCDSIGAEKPEMQRGKGGLVLLTNYAHPMNPGYRTRGIGDELRILRDVAGAVAASGLSVAPMRWKPHPAIYSLPRKHQERLRSAAASLGFEEIDPTVTIGKLGKEARWLLTTPSTVVADLLQAGTLAIVLDWQESSPGADALMQQFPSRVMHADEIVALMTRVDEDTACGVLYDSAWEILRPAGGMVPSGLDQPTT